MLTKRGDEKETPLRQLKVGYFYIQKIFKDGGKEEDGEREDTSGLLGREEFGE